MNNVTDMVHRFIRIPVAQYATARELLDVIVDIPEAAKDMFTAKFNNTGAGAATHLISSGLIDSQFAAILGNAPLTFGAYSQRCAVLQKVPVLTLADITSLYAIADIRSDAQGYEQVVLNLLGMKATAG